MSMLRELSVTARAKINLSLNVLGKREDGYHTIESLMQPLSFGDTVSVELNQTGKISLTTNVPELPTNEGNIAYRAAQLMLKQAKTEQGVSIHIQKCIPIAAGLAGGSTNAAAVLRLMNRLLQLALPIEALARLGVTLGADVPFCLYDRPMLAEGIGEKLTPTCGLSGCHIVLVNPGVSVSTADIYRAIDSSEPTEQSHTQRLLAALAEGNLQEAKRDMVNMMQPVAIRYCPAIYDLLTELKEAGAVHSMMSGSGATCFGIFTEKPNAEQLAARFGNRLVTVTTPYWES